MIDNLISRGHMFDALREELIGPAPVGEEIDCTDTLRFSKREEAFKPYRQAVSGEEILMRGGPLQRYGVGVLYPGPSPESVPGVADSNSLLENAEALRYQDDTSRASTDDAEKKLEQMADALPSEPESDDFDLSLANAYQPSSAGVSFLVDLTTDSQLVVEVPRLHCTGTHPVNGRYESRNVEVLDKDGEVSRFSWWLRVPLSLVVRFNAKDLMGDRPRKVKPAEVVADGVGDLKLEVEVYSRPQDQFRPQHRLLTVCLVNRTATTSSTDHAKALFQTHFHIRVERADGAPGILPYPGPPLQALDPEEKSIALLYRDVRSFATGHGCAASWDQPDQERVRWVSAENLPTAEVPGVTPDIRREDHSSVKVSMEALGQLEPGDEGFEALEEVIARYETWIASKRRDQASLEPAALRDTARDHLDECERCARRMRDGLEYLKTDATARFAFQLANRAVLLQQICGGINRKARFDSVSRRVEFDSPYPDPSRLQAKGDRGSWRAFQIAFLLMSLRSSGEATDPDRERVELIWFPTGGGKTEAYLGLSAFSMFMRRLNNPGDTGVHTLMRYTLRLLTAQQFQRASGLIVAMDHLRRRHTDRLGSKPFSIGIWLGGSSTPNSNREAVDALTRLSKEGAKAQNPFLLTRCPWCGGQLGPLEVPGSSGSRKPAGAAKYGKGQRVEGYYQRGKGVGFRCNDPGCDFHNSLPIYVVDEDIYEQRPTLVIGTADKFAMLAWKPAARALFGLDDQGVRDASPPGLIIQDELHLIAGPLGSMVGLYELLIEELCTDHRGTTPVRPKIVCSTATIRRYADQIRALYARDAITLFPPPGLEAGDSFFSKYDTDEQGKRRPGRLYVGVNAPGLGSLQTTEVRAFSALLQAPLALGALERDPWWTLLVFFNSLRELGGALSLFQSDIPDHLGTLVNRLGLNFKEARRIDNPLELTSRLESEDVPRALQQLEVVASSQRPKPVDVCLASSIIEVGIDIERLSLMAIVGQPKSTSQYIQVSGRVGRKRDRPGMVVTLYAASKPRDRSHFEKFRSYHERLYAQVEPTSVTPFSPPAVERALHAVMAAYVQQTAESGRKPAPFPLRELEHLKKLVLKRVSQVDGRELARVEDMFNRRMHEWEKGQRERWEAPYRNPGEDPPLLHPAGKYMPETWRRVAWPTPQSMRNVDSECLLEIMVPEAITPDATDQTGGH